METTSDKLRALGLSIGVHLACVLVVVIGLFWTRTEAPLSVAGSPIEATLVSEPPSSWKPAAEQERVPAAPTPAAPKPQPDPEPRPQQAEAPPQVQPQAPVRQPDTRETERAALLAQQAEETAKREEQERRRQEQVLLEEQKRQQEAERRERQRQQQLAQEQELADIRRQREEAEKRRKLEAEKLKQIEDMKAQVPATPTPSPTRDAPPADRLGNNGTDDSLRGRYALAIQQAVTGAWLRPENVTSVQCRVRIIQIPGGEVISASILSPCPADELTRRSIEAAVLKAQPLPYRGYESVFSREVTATFCYPRDRCR